MEKILASLDASLAAKAWYPSLFCALTLPDICAKIDNQVDKTYGKLYAAWFDQYVAPRYTHWVGAPSLGLNHCFLNGSDCYALRCAALHEGSDIICEHHKLRDKIAQYLVVAPSESGASMHRNQCNNVLMLQVNDFCRDVMQGVSDWLVQIKGDAAKEKSVLELLEVHPMNLELMNVLVEKGTARK